MLNGAYIVPHPPLLISEIGKGKQRELQNTRNAYQMIVHDIVAKKPQTIIVFTPHAPAYRDFIHISAGPQAYGDFSEYGAADVGMKVLYDEEFIQQLCEQTKRNCIPAGILGEQEPVLDHGTMVPLYMILQEYTDFQVVRISISNLDEELQIAFGNCLRDVIDASDKRIAILASGDLSHKVTPVSPYGYDDAGVAFDNEIVRIIKENTYEDLFEIDKDICEASSNCALSTLYMLYGAIQKTPMYSQFLCYENPFGIGYATAILFPMKKDPYVNLAKRAVESYVLQNHDIYLENEIPDFLCRRKAAVFVTIMKFDELRGCIGSYIPTKDTLVEEIIANAIEAATNDPRFLPIQPQELPYLTYSVDVLKNPERIQSLEELDVKKYGVIVRDTYHKGLLLPNLEGIETKEQQVMIALHKAGMDEDAPFILERFETTRHNEYHE